MLLQLCLRQQSQIAGPFLELVQSLRPLHLLPQRAFATDASGGSAGAGNSSSSSSGQEGTQQGSNLEDSFHRRVEALQSGQSQAGIKWMADAAKQPTSSTEHRAAGKSSSSSSYRAAAGDTDADIQEGLGVQVHPKYGYAELGGVDPTPNATMQVPGQNQPGVHPTRKFSVRDMYNPTDLNPLAQEDEEAWVPQFNRGGRETPVSDTEVKAELDYKNINFLLNFVSASGRIKPRRQTRLKPRLQSRVARTVKLARQMALIPYEMRVGDGGEGDTWRRMREFRAAER